MADFEGRHVMVTGGGGGLGAAVVREFAGRGATCHIPCYSDTDAQRIEALELGDRAVAIDDVDLADEARVARVYADLSALWASVHCAGGFAMGPIVDSTKADFERQMEMNYLTCALCCREAVRAMRRAGGGGRIVNVTARPAVEPRSGAGMACYTASKAAVAAFSEALAEEVVSDGILVNAVAPSIMDTPTNRDAMPDADHNQWAPVEDVASTIAFLASPTNAVTRGGVVPVYGRS